MHCAARQFAASDTGVIRLVYTRQGPLRVFYRQSSDGVHWSTAERAAKPGYEGHVGYAGKIIVLYRIGTGDAYVTTGT